MCVRLFQFWIRLTQSSIIAVVPRALAFIYDNRNAYSSPGSVLSYLMVFFEISATGLALVRNIQALNIGPDNPWLNARKSLSAVLFEQGVLRSCYPSNALIDCISGILYFR